MIIRLNQNIFINNLGESSTLLIAFLIREILFLRIPRVNWITIEMSSMPGNNNMKVSSTLPLSPPPFQI